MEELDTSGFYKENNGEWFYASNYVYSLSYTLERDGNKVAVDGWEWYDGEPQEYTSWYNQLISEIENA